MRKVLLFVWLLLPPAIGAYHYGPGQDRLRSDRAAQATERAEKAAYAARAKAVIAGDDDAAVRELWAEAEAAYTEALELLPSGEVAESRALRLERAKAQMFVSKLPEARRDLETLVNELEEDASSDPKLAADARGALANAQYYTTWLMRLEGSPRDEWEREIEASRQNYKLIAEQSEESGDTEIAALAKKDLESAIRLARMEIEELQGLPLPSQ
jgi:hypothetical protein